MNESFGTIYRDDVGSTWVALCERRRWPIAASLPSDTSVANMTGLTRYGR